MAAGQALDRRALPADGSAMARFAAEHLVSRRDSDAKRDKRDSESREKTRARKRRWWRKAYADPKRRERLLARHRAFHAANREELNERQRRRNREDPHRHEKRRARVYGLSTDAYNAILARQHGGCGVCKRTGLELCVDHDHATNKVRGLLCHNCNKALGLFQDDPDVTEAATAWLRQPRGDG